jgi:hypothetical protein
MRTSIGTAPHSPESNWILGPQRLKPKSLRSSQSARVEPVPFPVHHGETLLRKVSRPAAKRVRYFFRGTHLFGFGGLGGPTRMKTSSHL